MLPPVVVPSDPLSDHLDEVPRWAHNSRRADRNHGERQPARACQTETDRERERERETERERDRDRDRETKRQRQSDRDRVAERQRDRDLRCAASTHVGGGALRTQPPAAATAVPQCPRGESDWSATRFRRAVMWGASGSGSQVTNCI